MVKIEFELQHEYGLFRDAIILPEDHTLSKQQIEDLKQQRFQAWIDSISNIEE